MVSILVAIIIILLVAWLIVYLTNSFLPIDARIKQVITVVVWVIAIIMVIQRAVPLLQSI